MSESSKKTRNNWNQDAISILVTQSGFSASYVRKALSGDRVGLHPDKLIKEYGVITAKLEKVIEQAKEAITQDI